uniref:Reverse transcriptase domain-containing protein n=1 Tax=Tanacetum cinerariifolium TaxID=118510 RepID=A0A6L2ME94_TANCI|nr:hypothetical protein [Tanacetum cinerariifolium]
MQNEITLDEKEEKGNWASDQLYCQADYAMSDHCNSLKSMLRYFEGYFTPISKVDDGKDDHETSNLKISEAIQKDCGQSGHRPSCHWRCSKLNPISLGLHDIHYGVNHVKKYTLPRFIHKKIYKLYHQMLEELQRQVTMRESSLSEREHENLQMDNGDVPLKSCLKASMIRNIDWKTIGKDGKPLCALRKPVRDKVVQSEGVHATKTKETQTFSFASVVLKSQPKQMVKISEMHNTKDVEGARVAMPMAAVEEVSSQFKNTLYGFFIGKRLAFPLVENYDEMEKVMEGVQWLIRLVLLFLNVWTPNMILMKEEINMCLKSWGRKEYARALVEVSAEEDLLESMVIVILKNDGKGHSLAMITIKYEWKPPRCGVCKVFDHMDDKCPKIVKVVETTKVDNDGFMEGETSQPANQKVVNEVEHIVNEKSSKNTTNEPSYRVNESDFEEVEELVLEDSQGTRIILGWNNYDVDVVVISQSDQVIHTRLWLKLEKKEIFCSFIYGHNRYTNRKDLWDNLCAHNYYIRSRPWCLLGDFNAALFVNDSIAGSSNVDIAMREFKECVDVIEVMDVPSSGLHFTWNQKPKGFDGILKKIDRVLSNMHFSDVFVGAHAIFQPYRTSDHAPAVLVIPTATKRSPKPFKFSNILTQHSRFKEVVCEGWSLEIPGFFMFRHTRKLKNLKKHLRKLLYDHGNLHDNVNRLRTDLDKVQANLDLDHFNVELREDEVAYVQAYNQAIIMQERFLKQKAKILWLKEGDSNSVYFHKAVKGRMSRSRIDVVADSDGMIYKNKRVVDAFVSHYAVYLGHEGITSCLNTQGLFDQILDIDATVDMVKEVCDKEIKEAMFSMGNDKSPGLDGYTAAFFKESWDTVSNDVIKAVKEFFTNGKLHKELNHTIIALIPKVPTPTRVNDYCHISCCNVLFKCISKIIANRIKNSLKFLISPNQSAFVSGRNISDNILLTHELMHNYHLDRGAPRCAFKVDIQKAYDTVDWGFLKAALESFGFHNKMIVWIIERVTTTSFSISINGSLHGYFKRKRGLRQGGPISPYLFMIVMEVLTLMLKRRVHETDGFTYHRFCSEMELINLCFADDLFLFAHGDANSAKIIMEALDEFKLASGLTPSIPKSKAYFCNVLNHTKLAILQVMPFEEGRLPVKYLGVPLVSSRLVYNDCKELIDKVVARTNDWKNKSLSIAGRLQLVQSTISSMHVYWASVFILPMRILFHIEQIMRGFLWCQGSMRKGKAKVPWDVVCLPKDEGGLGIRRLDLFNKALMAVHVWKLLTMKKSKVLQLRLFIRKFVWHSIGDGTRTSIWYDQWGSLSPLADFISTRDMFRAGLSTTFKVADVMGTNSLEWPRELSGTIKPFAVNTIWHSIHPRDEKVISADVVWFSNCIPRHVFVLWLVIKKKLKTQDRLSSWDVNGSLVWHHMRDLVGLSHLPSSFEVILDFVTPMAKRRTSSNMVSKLVLAASVYFIWLERNDRLFNNSKRTVAQVIECIMSAIRLKLMSCRFKKSKDLMISVRSYDLDLAKTKTIPGGIAILTALI